jgi:hypothetical protein
VVSQVGMVSDLSAWFVLEDEGPAPGAVEIRCDPVAGERRERADQVEFARVAVLWACRSALRVVASIPCQTGRAGGPSECWAHLRSAGCRAEAQGFVLITFPDGESTYHRPPLMFRACPVALPGAVSETNVYKGQPA